MDENIVNALNWFENDFDFNNVIPVAVNLAFPLQGVNVPHDIFQHRLEHTPKNEHYFEVTIPLYNLSDFKKHFRMSRESMEVVIQAVGNRIGHVQQHIIPIPKKVHFAVWMLSKPETFLAGGDRFNFSRSTAHYVFTEIVNCLAELVDEHIIWPNANKQRQSAEVFQVRSHGFPGIVGVLDGCHIKIKQPIHNANDFWNRKQFHSIILQGICDEDCKFMNVAVGFPGRLHDARVFRISDIGQQLLNDPRHLIPLPDRHLIADSAYPLKSFLLTPFQDNGHLLERQYNYNRKLCSVRSTIERAFGRLKSKFRRLKLLELTSLQFIVQSVTASCVVHNIIINNDGLSDDEYSEDDDDEVCGDENLYAINVGQLKRNGIVNILP